VALILAGAIALAANPRHWPVAVIVIAFGVSFLLSNLDVVDLGSLILPAALILIGLMVLFGRGMGSRVVAGDRIASFNLFSGSEVSSHSKEFRGGSVSAMFGGAEVDLRDARPAVDASLDVFTAFGGVEIKVPRDWQVLVKGLPMFGGIENVTAREQLPDGHPVLTVNATVLFGGLEIKH
jgi:hypothetical protein